MPWQQMHRLNSPSWFPWGEKAKECVEVKRPLETVPLQRPWLVCAQRSCVCFVLLRVVLDNNFLSRFRKPRAGRSVFCLRSVHRTRLDPAGPGAKGVLPNWLQTLLRQKTSSGAGERQRQQRQRWRFGHHFGPVSPQAPQVREDFEHERLHFGGGAGASSAAGGAGAHHPGDLDERPAGHPRDQEPQPLLLSDGESNRPALRPGASPHMIEEREGRNIMWVSPLFLPGVLPGAVWIDSNKAFPVSFSLTYCYHPSSRTLSGFNSGGCQLHFLVAGRKVTITVLPCCDVEFGVLRYECSSLGWRKKSSRFRCSFKVFWFPFPEDCGRIVNKTTNLERWFGKGGGGASWPIVLWLQKPRD